MRNSTVTNYSNSSSDNLPTFLLRQKSGLSIGYNEAIQTTRSKRDVFFRTISSSSGIAEWSPSGVFLAYSDTQNGATLVKTSSCGADAQVAVYRLQEDKYLKTLPARQLKYIQWSPQGNYLVIYWNFSAPDSKNLFVWKVLNNEPPILFAEFSVRRFSPAQWPIIDWRSDEACCSFVTRHRIEIFTTLDKQCVGHLDIEGVYSARMGARQSVKPHISFGVAFGPSVTCSKDTTEASFCVFAVNLEKLEVVNCGTHKVGNADCADLMWSSSGGSLLVMTHTLVDAAGENYGGVGDLFFTSLDDPTILQKINSKVVQDAKWSPCRDEFIMIEGISPSAMYLFNKFGQPKFTFPRGYRNTIRWDPFGLMVALGGFGNMAGDLSFWYRDAEAHTMQIVAEWREPYTVVCEWGPSGRHFATASTHPRMKVGNTFKIFDFEGNLICTEALPELYDFKWKPNLNVLCPTRPNITLRETTEKKPTYRSKKGDNSFGDTKLIGQFLRGEIDEKDLPEEMRKSIQAKRHQRHGTQTKYSAVNKNKDLLLTDWRGSKEKLNQASMEQVKKPVTKPSTETRAESPPTISPDTTPSGQDEILVYEPSEIAPPAFVASALPSPSQPLPEPDDFPTLAKAVADLALETPPGDPKPFAPDIVTLLRSILPSTAGLHVRPTSEQMTASAAQIQGPPSLPHQSEASWERQKKVDPRGVDPYTDRCWEYIDSNSNIQGPFSMQQMRVWFRAGFFQPTLPVRWKRDADFVPLRQMFPSTPFSVI